MPLSLQMLTQESGKVSRFSLNYVQTFTQEAPRQERPDSFPANPITDAFLNRIDFRKLPKMPRLPTLSAPRVKSIWKRV